MVGGGVKPALYTPIVCVTTPAADQFAPVLLSTAAVLVVPAKPLALGAKPLQSPAVTPVPALNT